MIGELQPIVLQVDELTDGRTAIRYMRRFEEVIILSEDVEPPEIFDLGWLTENAGQMRAPSLFGPPMD